GRWRTGRASRGARPWRRRAAVSARGWRPRTTPPRACRPAGYRSRVVLVVPVAVLAADVVEELVQPARRVGDRVVLEAQLGRDPHAERPAEGTAQERRRAAQRGLRLARHRLRREGAELDARHPQVGRDADVGDGDRLQPRVTRLAQQEPGQLGPDQVRHAIATMLSHRLLRPSVVQELDPLLAQLGELQAVDELHDLAQARVHVTLLRPDLAHAEDGSLPVIVLLALV